MWKWILILISILFISGCGEENTSSANSTSKDENVLVLNVNKVTIGAFSNIPRMQYTIVSNMLSIANISVNKEADIFLSGADKELFKLKDSGDREKQLSLVNLDILPKDFNKDGLYELDIIAKDANNQIATCKIAYIINPAITELKSKDILRGNLFYLVDAKGVLNNGYKVLEFIDRAVVSQEFIEDNLLKESIEEIFYLKDSVIFLNRDEKRTCSLIDNIKFISLSCKENGEFKEEIIAWRELDNAKHNPSLSNQDRTLESKNIINSLDSSAPTISKFSLMGTTLTNNGRVQLDKSINSGRYNVTIELSEKLKGSEKAYLFFHKASSLNILKSGSRVLMQRLSASTVLEATMLEDEIHQFSILGQKALLDNSEKFIEDKFHGYLNLFICEDVLSFRSCHYADIPVSVE